MPLSEKQKKMIRRSATGVGVAGLGVGAAIALPSIGLVRKLAGTAKAIDRVRRWSAKVRQAGPQLQSAVKRNLPTIGLAAGAAIGAGYTAAKLHDALRPKTVARDDATSGLLHPGEPTKKSAYYVHYDSPGTVGTYRTGHASPSAAIQKAKEAHYGATHDLPHADRTVTYVTRGPSSVAKPIYRLRGTIDRPLTVPMGPKVRSVRKKK